MVCANSALQRIDRLYGLSNLRFTNFWHQDRFELEWEELGEIEQITIGHDNRGIGAGWHLATVRVSQKERAWNFECHQWLDEGDGYGHTELFLYPVAEHDPLRWSLAKAADLKAEAATMMHRGDHADAVQTYAAAADLDPIDDFIPKLLLKARRKLKDEQGRSAGGALSISVDRRRVAGKGDVGHAGRTASYIRNPRRLFLLEQSKTRSLSAEERAELNYNKPKQLRILTQEIKDKRTRRALQRVEKQRRVVFANLIAFSWRRCALASAGEWRVLSTVIHIITCTSLLRLCGVHQVRAVENPCRPRGGDHYPAVVPWLEHAAPTASSPGCTHDPVHVAQVARIATGDTTPAYHGRDPRRAAPMGPQAEVALQGQFCAGAGGAG